MNKGLAAKILLYCFALLVLVFCLRTGGKDVSEQMYTIGSEYESKQDYIKAMEYYEKSAELGNITAMNQIGYMYGKGNGVEKDRVKSLEWYEKAADLGDEDAKKDAENIREFLQ